MLCDKHRAFERLPLPPEVIFATKPELAWRMLQRTLDAGLPVAWVAGDTVYGSALSITSVFHACHASRCV